MNIIASWVKGRGRKGLGVLEDMWDAWTPIQHIQKGFTFSRYYQLMEWQFDEFFTHIKEGKQGKAANEVVDMISIALNLLRRLGLDHKQVEEVIRNRIWTRYVGQTERIMERDLKEMLHDHSDAHLPGR